MNKQLGSKGKQITKKINAKIPYFKCKRSLEVWSHISESANLGIRWTNHDSRYGRLEW